MGQGRAWEAGGECGCWEGGWDVMWMSVPQDRKQPLHWASDCGHCDVASVLIEKGAPLDVADNVSGVVGGGGGHRQYTERPCQ